MRWNMHGTAAFYACVMNAGYASYRGADSKNRALATSGRQRFTIESMSYKKTGDAPLGGEPTGGSRRNLTRLRRRGASIVAGYAAGWPSDAAEPKVARHRSRAFQADRSRVSCIGDEGVGQMDALVSVEADDHLGSTVFVCGIGHVASGQRRRGGQRAGIGPMGGVRGKCTPPRSACDCGGGTAGGG
jgi:hypothetical protein